MRTIASNAGPARPRRPWAPFSKDAGWHARNRFARKTQEAGSIYGPYKKRWTTIDADRVVFWVCVGAILLIAVFKHLGMPL